MNLIAAVGAAHAVPTAAIGIMALFQTNLQFGKLIMTTFLIILFLALIITCVVLWYLLNESNDEVKSLTHRLNNAWGQEQTTRDDARKACEDALAAYAEMERRQANLRRFLQSLRDRLKHNLLQREGPKSIGSIVDDEFDEWWDRWENDGGR